MKTIRFRFKTFVLISFLFLNLFIGFNNILYDDNILEISTVSAFSGSVSESFDNGTYQTSVTNTTGWGDNFYASYNGEYPGEIWLQTKHPELIGEYNDDLSLARGIYVYGDYVYTNNDTGYNIAVIDVSDPTDPTHHTTIPQLSRNDITGDGSYLYTVYYNDLRIIDLSDNSLEGSCTIPSANQPTGGNYGMAISGNYLYVTYGSSTNGNFYVFDVTNRASPSYLAHIALAEAFATDIYIDSGFAYVANYQSGLRIIDISTPSSPSEVGSYDDGDKRAFKVYKSGMYCYVAYEDSLKIINVNTPSSPSLVAELTDMYCDINGGIYKSGNYLYITYFTFMFVVDVSDVNNPVYVNRFHYGDDSYGQSCVVGNYLYLPQSNSFQIVQISDINGNYAVQYEPKCVAQSANLYVPISRANFDKATLSATADIPTGTSVTYFLSADDGTNWEEVTDGVEHTFTNQGEDLRWRAFLETTNPLLTPNISHISINYHYLTNGPTLTSPSDGSVLSDTTPLLKWNGWGLETTWRIELSTSTDFTSDLLQYTHTTPSSQYLYEFEVPTTLTETTWYWRVAFIDSQAEVGHFSNYWSLTIDSSSPTIGDTADTSYSEGSSGNSLTWICSDTNPSHYNITLDGTDIDNGDWNGTNIQIDINGLAYGDYTYICTVHDESGLSASDIVSINVYDSTLPITDSPSNQSIEQGTSISITWTPSDINPHHLNITRNITTLLDDIDWDGSSYTHTTDSNLDYGHYVYNIIFYDIDWNNVSDIVGITVQDTTNPTFGVTPDLTYEEGDPNQEIVWDPDDLNPWYYNITYLGSDVQNGFWDGTTITYDVSGLSIGDYEYICTVTDELGQTTADSVTVYVVDTTGPSMTPPSDTSFENETIGRPSLTWIVSDYNPDWYNITQNGVLIEEGIWDGNDITIDLDDYDFTAGWHDFNCSIFDTEGHKTSTIVKVEVFILPPVIDHPDDLRFPVGTNNQWINWTVTDVNPYTYTIYYNNSITEVVVDSDGWTSADPIEFNLDPLALPEGNHNFTIVVLDSDGLFIKDTVWVEIADWPVITQFTGDITVDISEGFIIYWNMTDDNPVYSGAFNNGTFIDSISWNSASWPYNGTIWVNYPSGLGLGVYNITITVEDDDGLISTDMVWVTVTDLTIPTISNEVDFTYTESESENDITWDVNDGHPYWFTISLDGIIQEQDVWDGSDITIDVDGLTIGVYEYICTVYDISNNSVSDTVIVTVIASIQPVIVSPGNVTIDMNTYPSIVWQITDDNPQSYSVYRDSVFKGTISLSGVLDNHSITYDIQLKLDIGEYNITIVIRDNHGNVVQDTVWLIVKDLTPPSISSQSDISMNDGETGIFMRYYPSDNNPDYYEVYINDTLVHTTTWTSGQVVLINLDLFNLNASVYEFTVIFYDAYDNSVSDITLVSVIDNIYPSFTSRPDDLIYNVGSTGNTLTWVTSEDNPDSFILYLIITEWKSGEWTGETITINIDGLEVGEYQLELVIIDISGNTASDYVNVKVTEELTISSPDDITVDDGFYESVTWLPSGGSPPYDYEVTIDGVHHQSGTWTNGNLEVWFQIEDKGEHTIIITLSNNQGDSVSDTVIIRVNEPIGVDAPGFTFGPILLFLVVFVSYKRTKKK